MVYWWVELLSSAVYVVSMETASDLWIQRSYKDGFNSRSKQTAPTSDDADLQNHSFDGSLYLPFQLLHCISCVNFFL